MGMYGGSAPSAPDYSGVIQAASMMSARTADVMEEQLRWEKDKYADSQARDQPMADIAHQMMIDAQDQAKADRWRTTHYYQPLEDDAIRDAQSFATPERKEYQMGKAQAAVNQQFDTARNNATAQLESFGIDPSSTRYAALDVGARTAQAAAAAAAGTNAADQVDAQGRALRSEAINIGRGYPGQVAQQFQTANQSGNSSTANDLAITASGRAGMGTPVQWGGLSNQATGIWGNTLNMQFQNQLDSYKAEQSSSSGVGALLGAVAGKAISALPFSDERVKEGAIPVGKTFDGQTIYRYRLKGQEAEQIGLMAQEVEQRDPSAVHEDEHGIKHLDYRQATQGATGEHGRIPHMAGGGAIPMPGMPRPPVQAQPAQALPDAGRPVPNALSPSRGAVTDDIPAMIDGQQPARINSGEFILPKDVVAWKGQEWAQKEIEKARKGMSGATARPQNKPAGALPVH